MLSHQPDDPGVCPADDTQLIALMSPILAAYQWMVLLLSLTLIAAAAGLAWLWANRVECLLSATIVYGLGFYAAFQI